MYRRKLLQSVAGKTLYVAVLSLLLIVVHMFTSVSSPLHAADSGQRIADRSCVQQCSPNTTEPRLASISERDEDDSPTPFQLLLAVASVVIAVAYMLPTLLKHVRRKLKIPIYKQVASFRI